MGYKDQYITAREAKKNPLCKAFKAFYIVTYPDGTFDYYPIGSWPVGTALTTKVFTLCNGKWKSVKTKH